MPETLTPPLLPEAGQSAPRVVEECSRAEWRQYLARRGGGTLYQRPEWDDAMAVYRLPVVWLAAMRDGAICGGGRFVWQRSLLFGNHLVSLPWLDGGGFVADDDEVFDALAAAAIAAAEKRGAATLLLKQDEARPRWPAAREDKVLLALDLPEDPDRLWKSFDPKVRNQVRKSEKSGLLVETGGIELLAEFHAVYSENMRDLGSPPHSLEFFDRVLRSFPEESRIHIVRLGRTAAGCGLTMANGQRLDIPWASSLQRYNSLCVNHALYWHILRNACRDGFRRFQFGRSSRGSGQHHFKKQWGADERPLNWYALDRCGHHMEQNGEQAASFRWAIRLWRRLPAWASRRLGPWVISKVS